jgi:hypothetical protein
LSDRDHRTVLIDKAIDAFNRADTPALLEFIHPEVVARVGAGLGNPGIHHGIQGYGEMMADWGEAWSKNTLALESVEFADDDTALVQVAQSAVGAGSGVPVEFKTVFMIGFEGDRAIRFEIHPDRDAAVAAL